MTSVKSSFVARFLSVVIMKFRASWASLTKCREVIAVYSFGRCRGSWEMKGRKAKMIGQKYASPDVDLYFEDGS